MTTFRLYRKFQEEIFILKNVEGTGRPLETLLMQEKYLTKTGESEETFSLNALVIRPILKDYMHVTEFRCLWMQRSQLKTRNLDVRNGTGILWKYLIRGNPRYVNKIVQMTKET